MFTSQHLLLLLLLLLLLPSFLNCTAESHLAVIELANGGTSRPLFIDSLDHDHSVLSPLKPQQLNAPPPENQDEVTGSSEGKEAQQRDWESGKMANKTNDPTENSVTVQEADNEETNATLPNASVITPSISVGTQSTSTSTSVGSQSTSTSTSPSTLVTKPTPKTSSTTPLQPQTTRAPTTFLPPPLHPCHQSCLEALNSTHLIPNDTVILSAGSSLTLECRMPLVPDLTVEDILWLFHPEGSPEGRCSLTSNKYLHSCPGFPKLSETDYSNGTFLKQILTLSGLGANHTGDYMCEVKVTCCPEPEQHPMAQQRQAQVRVTVWWADYNVQLAVTGAVAAVLLLGLIGVSLYGLRQGRTGDQYEHLADVEVQGVLHLPLIDDQDTDSFDSSIADEHD